MIKQWKMNRVSKSGEVKKSRMLVLRKKQITVTVLLILVGAAGYLNWNFQQRVIDPEVAEVYNEVTKKIGEAQMVSADVQKEDASLQEEKMDYNAYFVQAKLERDTKRSESIDMLRSLLETQTTDKEAKKQAEEELYRLVHYTEQETAVENLVKAKGFSDAIVFMGENLVSIAVKSNGLNEIDAAVLQDAVMSTTGYSADKIKIVEVE